MKFSEIEKQTLAIIETEDAETALEKLVEFLHDKMPDWHWVGIYLLVDNRLYLGPYKGEPTEHKVIEVGRGVCGTAVKEDKNQIVDDVKGLDNYIACSLGTSSEIVVLIKEGDRVLGQFDIDSDRKGAFGKDDEVLLEKIAEIARRKVAALQARISKELISANADQRKV